MPKRKADAAISATPGRLTCPACKSEISSDGATLHTLSKYLEELIETAGDVEKLEKALSDLEGKHAKAKVELQKKEVPAVPAVEAKPKTEATKNVGTKDGNGSEQRKPSSWW
jgi:hypothetical protein